MGRICGSWGNSVVRCAVALTELPQEPLRDPQSVVVERLYFHRAIASGGVRVLFAARIHPGLAITVSQQAELVDGLALGSRDHQRQRGAKGPLEGFVGLARSSARLDVPTGGPDIPPSAVDSRVLELTRDRKSVV